ncbi:MAG: D-alanyl-D-alanine carboxypeptidase [Chloroflexi bacterium]|nr:D-alanyl-D-alanine carboxypeptidase [Chloroflexota bacterium]
MPAKYPLVALLVIASLLCSGFGPAVLTESDLAQRPVTPSQLRAWRLSDCPGVSAKAYMVVSPTTGQVLCAHNEHERHAPASLVKIVTALVALEHNRQDEKIMVQWMDVTTYSVTRLLKGEVYSLRELLMALLVPSDNAAALTIARHVAGDAATFVGWMNDYVARLGLQDTHFANPHGLDAPDGYSTAYDMAILARYAMANPSFADFVGRSATIVGDYLWPSTNQLYGVYPGVIGVKTGTTDEAGECLIAYVDRPQGEVLTVVLGSEDRYADTTTLLNYYYATYAEVTIDLPENAQNRYLDEDQAWHGFRLEAPVTLLVNPADRRSVSFYRRIDNATPAPRPGEQVGVLLVTMDGTLLAELPLLAR